MEGSLYSTLCIVTFSLLFFVSVTRSQLEKETWNNTNRPGGRYYSFSTCAYKLEAGYTCLSCTRALHCYPSNFAILVDCPLILPYCRNGRCSRTEGAKCSVDQKLTTTTHANVLADEGVAPHNESIIVDLPVQSNDIVTNKDELVPPLQENVETVTGVSSPEV